MEPLDLSKIKIERGGAGVGTLPRVSLRDRFAGYKRCPHGLIGVCPECETQAQKQSEAETQGLPTGLSVQTTVTMPGNASNKQVEGYINQFKSLSSPETLKALETERGAIKARLEDIDRLILQLKLLTGVKRKYNRKAKMKGGIV